MIECEFHAFLAAIVDISKADQVTSYFSGRVVPAVFAQQSYARYLLLHDTRRIDRIHVPLQVHEFLIHIARQPRGK